MVCPLRSRLRAPSLGALAQKIGALGLSLMLVLASLTAGQAYWWCIPMQQAMVVPCCDHDGDADDEAAAPLEGAAFERECCIGKKIGELPAVDAPGAPERLAIAPVAIIALPLPAPVPGSALSPRPIRAHAAPRRHGPTRDGPRFALDRCVDLQVFRC